MAIIDLTELRESETKFPSPCRQCKVGYGSLSQYTDPTNGHLMQKSTSCTDDCQRLKEWMDKPCGS